MVQIPRVFHQDWNWREELGKQTVTRVTSVTTGSPLMARTPNITPTWMSGSHSLWKIRGGRIIVTTSQSFYHIFEHTSAIVIVIVVVTFGKYIFVSGTAFASTRLVRNTCPTGATSIRSPKSIFDSPSAVISFPRPWSSLLALLI